MLLQQKPLVKRIESIFVLLLFSFLLLNPVSAKADGNVEISGSIQTKSDSSITVNSIEILVNSSTRINSSMHSNVSFDSLKVGSYVKVEANSQQNGKLVARNILLMNAHASIELEGSITALTANSFTVNGTEVFVDSTTVIFTQYHAALKFADLKIGYNVSVKAAQTSGGKVLAIAVIVLTKNSHQEIELEGKIQAVNSNSVKVLNTVFFVDSTTIILKEGKGVIALSGLAVGDQVEIRGFRRPDSTYLALTIKVENNDFGQKVLELDGAITAISANSFVVSNVTVYVDSSTVVFADEGMMLGFSDLKVGDQVEVKATLQSNGHYLAARVKLENDESKKEIELEGFIQTVNSDNITVGGYTIYVNSQTKIYDQFKHSISFSDLKVGTFVAIKAYLQTKNYFATSIKVRDKSKTEIHVTGAIDSINGSSITVKGTVFVTDQNTEFLDNNRIQITINDLKVGQIVNVDAVVQSGNQNYALKVKVEDFWRSTIIVEGTIDNLTANSLTVSSKIFAVDSTTVIVGNGTGVINFLSLTLGMKVEVKGKLDANGKLIAKLIKVHSDNEFEVYGKIDSLKSKQLVIAGLTITVDNNTVYYNEFDKVVSFDSLKVNQYVEVKYVKVGLTENLAVRIEIEKEPNMVEFNGAVTSAIANNIQLSVPSFSVSSNTVFISSSFTQIQSSSIQVGQSVTVWATQDQSGNLKAVQVQQVSGAVTSVSDGSKDLPVSYELKQNYPNPFNPSTNITFTLAKPENVTLKVFNIIGQVVATLVNGPMNAGSHLVVFNASNLASGVYFYRLKVGDNFVSIKKMVLLK